MKLCPCRSAIRVSRASRLLCSLAATKCRSKRTSAFVCFRRYFAMVFSGMP